MSYVAKVSVDGTVEVLELKQPTLKFLRDTIGCQYVDVLRLSDSVDCWIDDEGLLNGSEPNVFGSLLAGTDQVIHGTMLFASTNSDGDTVGLPNSVLRAFRALED